MADATPPTTDEIRQAKAKFLTAWSFYRSANAGERTDAYLELTKARERLERIFAAAGEPYTEADRLIWHQYARSALNAILQREHGMIPAPEDTVSYAASYADDLLLQERVRFVVPLPPPEDEGD